MKINPVTFTKNTYYKSFANSPIKRSGGFKGLSGICKQSSSLSDLIKKFGLKIKSLFSKFINIKKSDIPIKSVLNNNHAEQKIGIDINSPLVKNLIHAKPAEKGKNVIKIIPYKDKETGEIREAFVEFTRHFDSKEVISVTCGGEITANAIIEPDPFTDKLVYLYGPGYQLAELGNAVYVTIMRSYKQGMGTVLHKAIAQRSKDFGYKGRVVLQSAWQATPFHYTCGFRKLGFNNTTSTMPDVEKVINEYKKTHQRYTGDFGRNYLYLTEEMAERLLKKSP